MTQRKLVPAEKDAYLKSGGAHCPFCGSDDIDAPGSVQLEGGAAWQDIHCHQCDAQWQDIYALIDVVPLVHDGEKERR